MENHYLDKDYEQLMNDSSIDPESPEVLYARSQCLKIGKGVAKDYTKYLELLHEAAEAGSAQAQVELKEHIEQEKQKTQETNKQKTVENASIYELQKMAKEKRADACYRLYQISLFEFKNKEEAYGYLEKAITYVNPARESVEFQQSLWSAKGDFLMEEGKENDAINAYKMAIELNHVESCWKVCEFYRKKNLIKKEKASKDYCLNKILQYGTKYDWYKVAEYCRKDYEFLKQVKILLQICEQAEVDCDEKLLITARWRLEERSYSRYPIGAYLPILWKYTGEEWVQKRLLKYYNKDRNKIPEKALELLTEDRRLMLNDWYKKDQEEAQTGKKKEAWRGIE